MFFESSIFFLKHINIYHRRWEMILWHPRRLKPLCIGSGLGATEQKSLQKLEATKRKRQNTFTQTIRAFTHTHKVVDAKRIVQSNLTKSNTHRLFDQSTKQCTDRNLPIICVSCVSSRDTNMCTGMCGVSEVERKVEDTSPLRCCDTYVHSHVCPFAGRMSMNTISTRIIDI